jgi:hypothetical protein
VCGGIAVCAGTRPLGEGSMGLCRVGREKFGVEMNAAGWVCEFCDVVRHACTKQVPANIQQHMFATRLQMQQRAEVVATT